MAFQATGEVLGKYQMTDPYHRLAVAILWQAVLDTSPAYLGRNKTMRWFLSKQSEWLLDYLEVTEMARKWVSRGCQRLETGRIPRKNKIIDRDWSGYYEH